MERTTIDLWFGAFVLAGFGALLVLALKVGNLGAERGNSTYRVEARFVSYPQPKPVKVPNVLGQSESMPSPGYAEFTLNGKAVKLDGVMEDPQAEQLFFILRDQTSGKETYGAGRFLYAELPKAGKIVLDFNKAYSPPCAFTPYATCPLPPPQNWMPVRVEAGEMHRSAH